MNWPLPLTDQETARLYWELSRRGAFCSGKKFQWKYQFSSLEELIALGFLQSRYDPRLLEILVDFFAHQELPIDPIGFKSVLKLEEALPLACVVGEFVLETTSSQATKELFHFLALGTRPVSTQLFFKGIYPIGGRKGEEVLEKPLWAFKKWGFLAINPPLHKDRFSEGRIYLYDETSRSHILKEIVREKRRIRMADYLKAVGFSISRQQALKDLKNFPGIVQKGVGRGTFYERVARS